MLFGNDVAWVNAYTANGSTYMTTALSHDSVLPYGQGFMLSSYLPEWINARTSDNH